MPVDGDEFNGAALDTSRWGAYDGPGHNGNGKRRPSQIAVANGVMTMSGSADGTTGGMELKRDRLYGRWETRMQVPAGNYAVEWTSTGIRGYIDGTLWFTDTNPAHLPPRSMHQTIQLDWFPSGATSTRPSAMNVAWMRYYVL
jgi:hypothetical protein